MKTKLEKGRDSTLEKGRDSTLEKGWFHIFRAYGSRLQLMNGVTESGEFAYYNIAVKSMDSPLLTAHPDAMYIGIGRYHSNVETGENHCLDDQQFISHDCSGKNLDIRKAKRQTNKKAPFTE